MRGLQTMEFTRELNSPPLFTTLRVNTIMTSMIDAKHRLQQCLVEQYRCRKVAAPVAEEHSILPDVLVVPSRGPIQRDECLKAVIVDHSCGCAVLRGANVFTRGMMAAPSSMCAGDLVSVYADIEGACRMGLIKPYTGKTVHVGNGVAKYSRADIFVTSDKPGGVGIEITEPVFDAPSLSGVLPELLHAQNLASAAVSHVVSPRPGECVLDMCAAPGGKTMHLATLMHNKGRLVALDKSSGKIDKVKDNCDSWGLSMVEAYVFDASRCITPDAVIEGGPPFPPEIFDRVLLDGPCSALGQRPMLVCKMSRSHLASHPALQKSIFAQAVKAVKRGGTLVYSTCTITTAENEEIVAWALHTYPGLTLVKQTPHLGGPGIQVDGLSHEQAQVLQRFGPACLITTHNQTRVVEDILNNTYSESHGEKLFESDKNSGKSHSYSCENSGEKWTNVNRDTIGFFIAKFVKS